MAARDIVVWRGQRDVALMSGTPTASSSFRDGEPVAMVDAGTLTEFPADGTVPVLADMDGGRIGGIAAMDGDTTRTDGFAKTTASKVTFYPFDQGIRFACRLLTDGSGAAVAKAAAMRGENFTLDFNTAIAGTEWSVATVAGTFGTDVIARIVDVVDDNGKPLAPGTTLTATSGAGSGWIVFELVTS